MNTYSKPHPMYFEGSDTYVVFFDVFHKNNKLYVILPLYRNISIEIQDLKILYNNTELDCVENIPERPDRYHNMKIFVYDFFSEEAQNTIKLVYGIQEKTINIPHTQTKTTKVLTLTTLFKNGYGVLPIFFDYYRKQGVEHFYMYYNGSLTDTPQVTELCAGGDITLIEWNFLYLNYHNEFSQRKEIYPQYPQMHHALYNYGKDSSKYMIFCDVDEYLFVSSSVTLNCLVSSEKNTKVDTFGFLNQWAATLDSAIPQKFPLQFRVSRVLQPYQTRSKCIHKTDTSVAVEVHHGTDYTKRPIIKAMYTMFHFFSWNQPGRRADRVNKVVSLQNYRTISLQRRIKPALRKILLFIKHCIQRALRQSLLFMKHAGTRIPLPFRIKYKAYVVMRSMKRVCFRIVGFLWKMIDEKFLKR